MKQVLASAVAALLISSAANAADLPRKAAAPFVPVVTAPAWTGFYVGIHAGYGGDDFSYPFSIGGGVVTGEGSITSSGFFGGGQIGYNFQLTPTWVVGIEADIAWSDIEGKISVIANAPGLGLSANAGSKLDWFGTVRARVGFLLTPAALLYATGGLAYGHVESSASATVGGLSVSTSSGSDKMGWTIGAGIEYALLDRLTLKAEYLYLDLGRDRISAGTILGVPFTLDEETKAHTLKVGLNFKLGAW